MKIIYNFFVLFVALVRLKQIIFIEIDYKISEKNVNDNGCTNIPEYLTYLVQHMFI